jgi:carbonic anhydrase
MKKITTYSAIALSTLLLFTACNKNNEHNNNETHHTKHWGYTGDVSPSHWGELSEDFKMCSQGKMQTPINVIPTKDIDLPELNIDYKTGSKSIIDNGHSVQVNIKDGSVLKIDGQNYKLKQFHFHTPSENNINSKSFPLEAHFVHATDDGKLAVVAVMFKEGAENPTLAKIWKRMPKLERGKEAKCGLSSEQVNSLMPKNRDYYKFMGSLTTPPCSEHVKWFVYKTPLTVSKAQASQFTAQFGHPNNRPIQPTNKREIDE